MNVQLINILCYIMCCSLKCAIELFPVKIKKKVCFIDNHLSRREKLKMHKQLLGILYNMCDVQYILR